MENTTPTAVDNQLADEQTVFRLWLQKQFTDICKRNSRYSLRAFAKNLEIDPSSLSQILSGKRKVSKKIILTFCEKLSATPKDLKRFGLIVNNSQADEKFYQLGLDKFSVISEWYHYAILELTYVSGFKADFKWIARKLSITVDEAKTAIERLKRLELILEENGSFIKSSKMLTNDGIINSSAAHKELQRQIVSKALLAIDECPTEFKDITSITMAIDTENIEKAKKLIAKFRRELCALLEDGEQTVVYNLGIQLYPISTTSENI